MNCGTTATNSAPFDGLDNRRSLFELFGRLGAGLPELQARQKRAIFLRRLLTRSQNGFAAHPLRIDPCSASEAYQLFIAITGVLGVPIEQAARILEEEVRRAGV